MNRLQGLVFVFALTLFSFFFSSAQASTSRHQFQLGTGVGVLFGSGALDPSFDFDLEPEFFLTDHMSVSFRFDATVGGLDSVFFGGRFRYYLTFVDHSKWSVYFGAGAGGMIRFDGDDLGDIAIPALGFQYDLTDHVKIGSDVSLDLIFGGDDFDVGMRLMPLQLKWAF